MEESDRTAENSAIAFYFWGWQLRDRDIFSTEPDELQFPGKIDLYSVQQHQ